MMRHFHAGCFISQKGGREEEGEGDEQEEGEEGGEEGGE